MNSGPSVAQTGVVVNKRKVSKKLVRTVSKR